MDLALALAEEDFGSEVALQTARMLVVYARRPGGQTQFSVQLAHQIAEREPLRDLQAWIGGAPRRGPLGLRPGRTGPPLRAAVRPRLPPRARDHPGRLRRAAPGRAGAERARVRHRLARGDRRRAAGSPGPRSCARAFQRRLGTSPSEYRQRFRPPLAALTTPTNEETQHADRHPHLPGLHGARRGRALRGPAAAPGGGGRLLLRAARGVVRTEQGMLGISADRTLDEVDAARTSSSSPAASGTRFLLDPDGPYAELDRQGPRDDASGRRRSAPGRCCSPPPASSTGSMRRRTGRLADCSASSARTRSPSGSSSAARCSRRPASPPGIDMALRLAELIAGHRGAQALQLGIEYDPDPPHRHRLAREGAAGDRRDDRRRDGGRGRPRGRAAFAGRSRRQGRFLARERGRRATHLREPPDLQRHPADRPQAPRQLHRRDPPVRDRPGPARRRSGRGGDLLHRRPPRDHRRLRPGASCASASTTRPRSCSQRGSTPSAACSSARATSASTPSSAGCSAA